MDGPIAMISYSWKDSVAAERLHDEFAMRGFRVVHDKYSFTDGSRVPSNMAEAVQACDVFVLYLTRASLYLDGAPVERPALKGEFLPAMQRRRRNLGTGKDYPIVRPLAHGLGDRAESAEVVHSITGEHIGSLWGPTWLDQSSTEISQEEAASVAEGALRAVLTRDQQNGPLTVAVATRGNAPAGVGFTLDATRLLGGERRAGEPADWVRFFSALGSIVRGLELVGPPRTIRLDPRCHLSAAVATGRCFHQASGWSVVVPTRHGDVQPASVGDASLIAGGFDPLGESGDLVVDIDLLGHNVGALTTSLMTGLPGVAGRLSLSRVQTREDPTVDVRPQTAPGRSFFGRSIRVGRVDGMRSSTLTATSSQSV